MSLAILLVFFITIGCSMEAEHTTYSDITHLEKTLSVQVQSIMPQEIVDIIDAAIKEESSDPQYEEYLTTFNQLLKELIAAVF